MKHKHIHTQCNLALVIQKRMIHPVKVNWRPFPELHREGSFQNHLIAMNVKSANRCLWFCRKAKQCRNSLTVGCGFGFYEQRRCRILRVSVCLGVCYCSFENDCRCFMLRGCQSHNLLMNLFSIYKIFDTQKGRDQREIWWDDVKMGTFVRSKWQTSILSNSCAGSLLYLKWFAF